MVLLMQPMLVRVRGGVAVDWSGVVHGVVVPHTAREATLRALVSIDSRDNILENNLRSLTASFQKCEGSFGTWTVPDYGCASKTRQ